MGGGGDGGGGDGGGGDGAVKASDLSAGASSVRHRDAKIHREPAALLPLKAAKAVFPAV